MGFPSCGEVFSRSGSAGGGHKARSCLRSWSSKQKILAMVSRCRAGTRFVPLSIAVTKLFDTLSVVARFLNVIPRAKSFVSTNAPRGVSLLRGPFERMDISDTQPFC